MTEKRTAKAINRAAAAIAAAAILAGTAAKIRAAGTDGISFMKNVETVNLPNGLRALVRRDAGSGVASVQVWVAAGSIYENEKTAGLSHFLEHLIFKGSAKFPGDEISRLVETSGGVINAGTSKEYTVYYIDIQKDAALTAIEILADAMQNASFPPEEIAKERPVVLEEIKRHDDDPESVLYETLSETLFPTSPYRKRIIGDEKVIASVSREEIIAYYKKYYVPSNMVVTIAGDVAPADAAKALEKYFGAAASAEKPPATNLKEKSPAPEKMTSSEKNVAHVYLACAYLGPDTSSDEQFAADVSAQILGGGQSSRLYRTLREKEQLVYGISSGYYSQKGDGIFEISAICERNNSEKTRSAVAKEIKRLADEGPSDEELTRAKETIKTRWLFGVEKAHDLAAMLGYWTLQDNVAILDEYVLKTSAVSRGDVKKFFAGYLSRRPAWAAVIPVKK